MSEQPSSAPEDPPAKEGALKRAAKVVGGGLGCLGALVGLAIVVFILLAYFFSEPTLSIAVVALLVAVAAYKASKRVR